MGSIKAETKKNNKIKTDSKRKKPVTVLSMAVKLKRKGLSVEDIAKATGLSKEIIETL